jgi:dynein heavy chain
MFVNVDKRWKLNLSNAQVKKNVREFTNDKELRDNMVEDITILDKVQKNLENYLSMKRTNFARLYFLSDEELLKINSISTFYPH